MPTLWWGQGAAGAPKSAAGGQAGPFDAGCSVSPLPGVSCRGFMV